MQYIKLWPLGPLRQNEHTSFTFISPHMSTKPLQIHDHVYTIITKCQHLMNTYDLGSPEAIGAHQYSANGPQPTDEVY